MKSRILQKTRYLSKGYLGIIGLCLWSLSSVAQNYNITAAPQCNTTAAGNEIFNFTGATPTAIGNGTATLYFKGDFDGKISGNEYLDLYGETGPIMANTASSTTGISNTQCNTIYDSIVVPVTMADLNNWASDGTITFTADGASGVSVTCSAPGTAYCAYIRLEYPRASGLNDIGIASLDSPTVFCAGPQNIKVKVQNYGLNQVDTFTVDWTWNGVAQTPLNLYQLLDTAQGLSPNNIQVMLGTKTITDADTLVAWTSNPNNSADTTNANDTLRRILAPSLNGTYTINSATATGGTNYQTFTDFASAITNYGMCGPVVINVATGSGPYNDQISLPQIIGSSATNTLTINGNGALLTMTTPSASNFATLNLDGADYVTVNNLIIEALGTNGFGVHLMNGADNNTFNNCTITANPTATGTTSACVSMSGSATSYSTAGVNGSNNTFDSCTLTGGYFGAVFYGSGVVATADSNNTISNCAVKEYYVYGSYNYYQKSAVISKSIFERPTRTSVSTGYGVFLTTGCINTLVEKNTIRDLFGGAPNGSFTSYALYCSVDGTVGNENKFINNEVYNIQNGGTGVLAGLYLTGADHVQAYHNTISLDYTASNGTGAIYGIYSTGTVGGIDIKNNNISITQGGTGAKQCLYFTGAGAKSSNYNNLYINASGTSNFIGATGTTAATRFATLTAWQGATGAGSPFDANSVSMDPQFISSTNLTPANNLLDNLGTPLANVTDDILNVSRSASTPDIGAYEFTVPLCTSPPIPGNVVLSSNNVCSGSTVQFTLDSNGVGVGQTYEWQSAPTATGPFTTISPVTNGPTYSTTVSSTTYYRAAVICNGTSTSYSDTVLITVPSPFAGGTYTIGGTAGPSNFPTFTDAVLAMRCGITGPVVMNVTPGTYNEQIELPATLGTSAFNTLIINGNGATLSNSTASASYATLNLDGADYVTVNNLNIEALDATNGFGVHLMNGADDNTFNNCNITASPTATGTTSACVSMSGSKTSYSTAGVNGSNNTFDSCTLTGGYFGFVFYGSGAVATADSNNIISNCIVKEYYVYGSYNYYQRSSTITNSIFERPTRTSVSTGYGILLTTGCTNMLIQKNIVRSLYGGAPVNTNTTYALYCAVDGTAGRENKFINNLVYNIQGSGSLYGMYLSGADYVQAYHNTIALDDINATAGTTYGIYNTGTAGGIDIKNNNIYITRGGTGTNYGLYYTGAGAKSSNYNNIYVAGGGTNNVGYDGTARPTLANWQASTLAGSPFDVNSLTVDPMFVNPATGNYMPTSAALDNLGTQLAAVPDDILGVTRSSTPDIGAYEFVPPTCPGPSALTAAVTDTTALLGWTSNSSATQWQIEYGIDGFTKGTGTVITTSSNPYNLTGLALSTSYQFYVRSICAPADSSTWSGPAPFATPPVNDSCVNAINITNGQIYNGTTAGATEDMLPCDPTTASPNGKDVWYSFTTGSVGGSVTVSVNTTTTGTDVVLSVFDGSCGALNIMTPTASSATTPPPIPCVDGPAAGNEYGTYTVLANTTYYVRVYGYLGAQGTFPIQATGTPLAIKLSDITATNVGNRNRVDWTTASEMSGDMFDVQRSTDGRNYSTLATIEARGAASTYSYWDVTPVVGKNYYRLYMKDASGNGSYSREVVATVKGSGDFTVSAHPNPVSDKLQVVTYGKQGNNPMISVIDVTGKVVNTISVTGASTDINMGNLAKGVYMIKYTDNSRTETIRVNKQ